MDWLLFCRAVIIASIIGHVVLILWHLVSEKLNRRYKVMGNMSYCRFQNTEQALQDCLDSINDPDISEEEAAARGRLIDLCAEIVEEGKHLQEEG